jgi:DNA replication protein DnaC
MGVSIARILVFQKTDEERLNMAIEYSQKNTPELNTDEAVNEQLEYLTYILKLNEIDVLKFSKDTYNHFRGKLGKVNNIFFYGQPSTGKTTIMQSLVECHFNYTRLTGLNPNSTFNFSSLLHTNACFMDECKLTDNQFEKWKLLASNSPMSTDIKYKESHDVQELPFRYVRMCTRSECGHREQNNYISF